MKKNNEDYENFVDKFETKLTTDDCYTPPNVYSTVLDYVKEKCRIEGLEVVRPFFPGGDYENFNYPENCVVVDNPPFSIISKIIRFYNDKKIKFFLFAPHLTVFSSDQDFTAIITGSQIIYENGANVKTAFVSNLFNNEKIIGDADLGKKIKDVQNISKSILPSYQYPKNIITVNCVSKIVEKGISITINKKDVKFCRGLDSQKLSKKAIFGSGFLISDNAVVQKMEALKAAEKKAAEKKITIWKLSEREIDVINKLNNS